MTVRSYPDWERRVSRDQCSSTLTYSSQLAGRGPASLAILLSHLPQTFVSGAIIAELSRTRGRLDPNHSDTSRILQKYDGALLRIDVNKVLVPNAAEWTRAGELAGAAARGIAGGGKSIRTAFDRMELINDATTALVSARVGATVVTSDRHFDLFMQLEPALKVAFRESAKSRVWSFRRPEGRAAHCV